MKNPFTTSLAVPTTARVGEVLHLTVGVTIDIKPKECFDVSVGISMDDAVSWQLLGASTLDFVKCTGEGEERITFPVKVLGPGELHLTVAVTVTSNSEMCQRGKESMFNKTELFRKVIMVEPEGVQSSITTGGIFCTNTGTSRITIYGLHFVMNVHGHPVCSH